MTGRPGPRGRPSAPPRPLLPGPDPAAAESRLAAQSTSPAGSRAGSGPASAVDKVNDGTEVGSDGGPATESQSSARAARRERRSGGDKKKNKNRNRNRNKDKAKKDNDNDMDGDEEGDGFDDKDEDEDEDEGRAGPGGREEDEEWTRVSHRKKRRRGSQSQERPSAPRPRLLHPRASSDQEQPYPSPSRTDPQVIVRKYRQRKEHFQKSTPGMALRARIMSQALHGPERRGPVTNAIVLGMGSLDPIESPDIFYQGWTELAAFEVTVSALEECGFLLPHDKDGPTPFKVYFQELLFTTADVAALEMISPNYSVVADPAAFALVTASSLVFGVHLYHDVYDKVLRSHLPNMFIGTEWKAWTDRGCFTEVNAPIQVGVMDRSTSQYTNFPFLADRLPRSFGSTRCYWRGCNPEVEEEDPAPGPAPSPSPAPTEVATPAPTQEPDGSPSLQGTADDGEAAQLAPSDQAGDQPDHDPPAGPAGQPGEDPQPSGERADQSPRYLQSLEQLDKLKAKDLMEPLDALDLSQDPGPSPVPRAPSPAAPSQLAVDEDVAMGVPK